MLFCENQLIREAKWRICANISNRLKPVGLRRLLFFQA